MQVLQIKVTVKILDVAVQKLSVITKLNDTCYVLKEINILHFPTDY